MFAQVTGDKVNRSAGFGLEIRCVYRLYGPNAYIDKMKQLVDLWFSEMIYTQEEAQQTQGKQKHHLSFSSCNGSYEFNSILTHRNTARTFHNPSILRPFLNTLGVTPSS